MFGFYEVFHVSRCIVGFSGDLDRRECIVSSDLVVRVTWHFSFLDNVV